jgi:HK97 family phage major capsid protein
MTIAEKRQKRAAIVAEARAILDKANNENRENTADEITAWQAKQDEAKRMLEGIEREERQARLEAENAVHVGGATPPAHTEVRDNSQGTLGRFANYVRAVAESRGDRNRAAQYAEQTLHDGELARALSASVATGGGFAVPTVLATEFIEFLRPASVVRSAGARPMPMMNGNLSIPKITGGAVASYVGENSDAPATQQTAGQVKLIAKKLMGLVPISNDLIRYANPQTDAVIREDLVRAVAQAEDLNFLRGDGTQFAPKGMRNWALSDNYVTATALAGAALAAGDVAGVTLWLGQMVAKLLTANVPVTLETGCWFLSPRTLMALRTLRTTNGSYAFPELSDDPKNPTLLGYKVKSTSQIPTNLTATPTGGSQLTTTSEIYFANMPDCLIGESVNLILDVSTEATYKDASGTLVSAFSQDQTVIRVIEENDFGVRYDHSVAVGTAVPF